MAKLSNEQIAAEVEAKGFKFIAAPNYTNLSSNIHIECAHGHKIEVSMADFRRPSFECPVCNKDIHFDNPIEVPEKHGYRIIAFDQATERFGLSIWDDGKLVFFTLYTFTGNLTARLTKIKKLLSDDQVTPLVVATVVGNIMKI